MKHIFILIAALLLATAAVAQEKESEYNTTREFKNKVFEIRNRDAREIAGTIKLLGSGFKGAGMNVNAEMRTITIRDFPENVAAIEEAIGRLDRAPAARPDILLKIAVLIGSKTPVSGAAVPEELAPVVKQLQSTLKYAHYGLMSSNVQHTKPGSVTPVEGSGVAEPTALGMTTQPDRPLLYTYRLRDVTLAESAERASIEIGTFNFSMRIPINTGNGIQYQSVGFDTPVSIRQNEKVVIGTTTMGDKALIVVVTAIVTK
jgi:hypothetical protein